QRVVRVTGVLGNENVTGPPQVPRSLAQSSALQKEFVPERRLSIDQNNVEPMFEMEILQTIIEQERISFPLVDRVTPALYAVFVDQNDHVMKIVRQHVWLVAGGDGIEEHQFPIRNDARRIDIFREQSLEPSSFRRFRSALVTAA